VLSKQFDSEPDITDSILLVPNYYTDITAVKVADTTAILGLKIRYFELHWTIPLPWSVTSLKSVYLSSDSTASQHLWGSRDVIGHVTI